MGVSIRPSQFVEGGAVPVDRNLLWEKCRFAAYDYKNKAGEIVATGLALVINYKDDDGGEYEQAYSAGDLKRFLPTKSGGGVYPAHMTEEAFNKLSEEEQSQYRLSKSSNYYILMNALVNAGCPENKLGDDVSVLDGLRTHNIGIPEPKRSGLVREHVEGARERVISVPDSIIQLPWEGKGKAAPAKKVAAAAPAKEEDAGDAEADALAMVTGMLAEADKVTRQQVATKAIRAKNQPVAKLVFSPKFAEVLLGAGFTLEGEDITAG